MTRHDTDIERSLRQVFAEHEHLADGPQPVVPIDRSGGWLRAPIPIVILACALAVAAGGIAHLALTPERVTPQPAASVGATVDPHISVTETRLDEISSQINLPPSALEQDRAPVPELIPLGQSPGTANVLTRTRWFVAPGTVAEATAYLVAHPPPGLSYRGPGAAIYPDGRERTELSFLNLEEANVAYTSDQLTVSLFGTASGVAGRFDAQAVWLPTRSENTLVPLPVTSVDVFRSSGIVESAKAALTGEAAANLGRLVNSMRAANPGLRSCPQSQQPADSVRLVFHSSRLTTVILRLGPCATAHVEIDGQIQLPALDGAQTISDAVSRAASTESR